MKKYFVILALFATLLASAPATTSADIVSDIKAKINDLLAQVKVLQQQLDEIQKNPPSEPNNKTCIELRYRLYFGLNDVVTGGEVSKLQEFLKEEGFLNITNATGFFGQATEGALKKWQAQEQIVFSGSPETTGFGAVGPLTRIKIKEVRCKTWPTQSIKVLTPNGGESWKRGTIQGIQWQDPRWVGAVPESTSSYPQSASSYYVDIFLKLYYLPCILGNNLMSCPGQPDRAPYTIAKSVLSRGLYNWTVGKVLDLTSDIPGDGYYLVTICQSGTSVCDSSNEYFNIVSTTTATSS